jgi:hypothetical protein
LRTIVAEVSDRVRSLKEAVGAARITVRESRALIARSRGRPYLATHSGDAHPLPRRHCHPDETRMGKEHMIDPLTGPVQAVVKAQVERRQM